MAQRQELARAGVCFPSTPDDSPDVVHDCLRVVRARELGTFLAQLGRLLRGDLDIARERYLDFASLFVSPDASRWLSRELGRLYQRMIGDLGSTNLPL